MVSDRVRRRSEALGVWMCGVLVLTGCDEKRVGGAHGASTGVGDAGVASAPSAADDAARLEELRRGAMAALDVGEPLNEKQYEVLVLSLASCEVDAMRGYIEAKCGAFEALQRARAVRNEAVPNLPGMWRLLGEKLLTHPSEAVRMYATQLLSASAGGERVVQDALLSALSAERSTAVIQAMIRTLRTQIGREPQVASQLIELSRHEDAAVREAALVSLTSLWAVGSEGTMARALEMIESDPVMEVRAAGCASLGGRADDAALPLLERYTAWPAVEPELYGDCARGLVGMWSAPQPHKRPSQAAYELTLRRLAEAPRSEERPAWMAISGISWASHAELAPRAPWLDLKALRDVLRGLALDASFNWLGRNASIDTMIQIGATRSEIEAMRDELAPGASREDAPQQERYVLTKLNDRIKTWQDYQK